jgi:hypothetical protein
MNAMAECIIVGFGLLVIFGWIPVLWCNPETPEEQKANDAWKDIIL